MHCDGSITSLTAAVLSQAPANSHMPTHQPERAMALMILAMTILPSTDAIAKLLAHSMSSSQITWSRFFFQSLLMLPLALRTSIPLLAPGLGIHAIRGILLGLATTCFFHALKYLELADAISIFFVEPLLLTLISALFLGETIGWRRIIAVMVGFGGALIVIRPSFATAGTPALLPLAAAFSFAWYLALTRRAAANDEPARMHFHAGLFGCLFMTLLLLAGELLAVPVLTVVAPTPHEWLLLALLGAIATGGHLLVTHAFKLANASLLAPFQYLELVSATLLGWWLFSDLPDGPAIIGAGIIVGSGLYVFHRERVKAR